MQEFFAYTSAILSIIMIIPYIVDIFKKTTKPERASWLIWTVLGLIAFFSQLAKGATDSLWLTAGQTISVLIVFILSIKYGVGGLNQRDIKALITAGIGLLLWLITKEALFALFIVIFIDFVGVFLTTTKAYKDPKSETISTWLMSGTSGIFGALAVGSFSFVLLAYPIYIVIANYIVVFAIILGKKSIQKT